MRIDLADVPAFERGVSLLGSGGGGDTATGALLLRDRLTAGAEATVVPLDELAAGTRVVPVGLVGATAVLSEKPPGGGEFGAAVSAIERWTGERVDALMSIEVGGLNGVLPLVAALDLGLPYVDADLSGRGLPRLDQFSLAAAGRGLAPAALAGPTGQVLVLAGGAPAEIERTVRSFLTSAGGWAVLALAPVPGHELPGCCVPGTASAALTLGRSALAAGESPGAPALARATGGDVLALGRIVEVARRQGLVRHGRPGFGRGSVAVEDHVTKSLLRLEMENEYLLALRDGEPVASTPDVLAVLDRRTGTPINCEAVRGGGEVAVLQLASQPFWTDPRHLPLVGPRAFGIDCDPVLR